MIGGSVTVTVLAVRGNQVRIGINAPREVTVHREEVYRRACDAGPLKAPKPTGRIASSR